MEQKYSTFYSSLLLWSSCLDIYYSIEFTTRLDDLYTDKIMNGEFIYRQTKEIFISSHKKDLVSTY